MRHQKGESLIELLVAMGIFVVVVSSVAFLVLDSYVSGRLAKEITQANFLAEEGIEAVGSIRDNSWSNLTAGNHGLAISGNNWVFQAASEDMSLQLKEGIRTITIEDIGSDRKKITSQIDWNFIKTRPQQVQLVTYLTNWQKIISFCQGTCTPCSTLSKGLCSKQVGCSWVARDKICVGTCTPCSSFINRFSCQRQLGCSWVGP